MKDLSSFIDNDAFAKATGIELVDYGEGRCKVKMEVGEKHLNSLGKLHGGAIFTLADAAFAISSNSRDADAVALNVSISYHNAVDSGDTIYAEAKETSLKRRVGNYDISITRSDGELVASFHGLAYRIIK